MNNREYWEKREKAKLNKGLKDVTKIEKMLAKEYKKAMDSISKEVAFLMSKYAKDNNLTWEEANKFLSPKQFKEFRYDIKTYVKLIEENADDMLLLELNSLSMRSRISRLEDIYYQVDKYINELSKTTSNSLQMLFSDTLEETYYSSLYEIHKFKGVATTFAYVDKELIERVLTYPWSGRDYSSRIWSNRTKLKNAVREEITQMIIQGKGLRETSKSLSKVMEADFNNCTRLINTEHARIMSETSKMSYEECDVDRYEIVATLDTRTSKTCQGLDGKVFKVSEGVVGSTLPPFHPFAEPLLYHTLAI